MEKATKKYGLTEQEFEEEIAELQASPYVALARREQRLQYRRMQYLYQLRDLEKKGKALEASGITRETIDREFWADTDEGLTFGPC